MSQKNDDVKNLHCVVAFFVENLEDWEEKIGIFIFFLQYCRRKLGDYGGANSIQIQQLHLHHRREINFPFSFSAIIFWLHSEKKKKKKLENLAPINPH